MRSPEVFPFISDNYVMDDPDLLEDMVSLLLGYDDPLSLSNLEALRDQEIGHLT